MARTEDDIREEDQVGETVVRDEWINSENLGRRFDELKRMNPSEVAREASGPFRKPNDQDPDAGEDTVNGHLYYTEVEQVSVNGIRIATRVRYSPVSPLPEGEPRLVSGIIMNGVVRGRDLEVMINTYVHGNTRTDHSILTQPRSKPTGSRGRISWDTNLKADVAKAFGLTPPVGR